MRKLDELIPETGSIMILGHVHPDGDCVGACLAAYNYLKKKRPQQETGIILEPFSDSFRMLKGSGDVVSDFAGRRADICLCLDAADRERLGAGTAIFDAAAATVCIDHHHTNEGYADVNVIDAAVSSASELLAGMIPDVETDRDIAECLYLGIVHDTGCFKHSNTGRATMETAGRLLEKGVSSARIIDDTFYKKTFTQNRLLGRALCAAQTFLDGKMIASVLRSADFDALSADGRDTDGIIDQLRVTEGVETAVLLYELEPGEFKISMRSNEIVDVSAIAAAFCGGGHVRAAGGKSSEQPEIVLAKIAAMADEQMRAERIRFS